MQEQDNIASERMDIVVNPYIKTTDFKRIQISPGLVLSCVLMQILAAWLYASFAQVFRYDYEGRILLQLVTMVLSMAGLVVLFWPYWQKGLGRPHPTNFDLTPQGLRLSWRQKRIYHSPWIPWDCIQDIDMQNCTVRLGCNLSTLTLPVRYRLELDTLALRAGGGKDLIKLDIDLDVFTREADKQKFLALLNALTKDAIKQSSFNEALKATVGPNYTQLWLDDMQSFKRKTGTDLPPGASLQGGKYIISERLAIGGQAKIYLATSGSDTVVIKEYVLPVHGGAEVRERSFASVKKEAILLSGLSHPDIVKLLDNFVEDHRAYLVLEYVPGSTLKNVIQKEGVLKPLQVTEIATLIAEILGYLHGQSPPVVHRDITPDNLILSDDGRVKLIDFNVAREVESGTTRTVVGKHNYMAPEQFKGRATTQSDLYSLGCTMFFLLTGKDPLPLACATPSKAGAGPLLDQIVQKLTAQSLDARYKDAGELLADLTPGGSSDS